MDAPSNDFCHVGGALQSHDQKVPCLDLHPIVAHFFRFWLWLTTGMVTRQWVAVHRKHHARCETADDPHSPQVVGLKKVLLEGSELYRKAAADPETIQLLKEAIDERLKTESDRVSRLLMQLRLEKKDKAITENIQKLADERLLLKRLMLSGDYTDLSAEDRRALSK